MRNCDIKFVNKEITPFGGLSLFFKMQFSKPFFSFFTVYFRFRAAYASKNAFPANFICIDMQETAEIP